MGKCLVFSEAWMGRKRHHLSWGVTLEREGAPEELHWTALTGKSCQPSMCSSSSLLSYLMLGRGKANLGLSIKCTSLGTPLIMKCSTMSGNGVFHRYCMSSRQCSLWDDKNRFSTLLKNRVCKLKYLWRQHRPTNNLNKQKLFSCQ